VACLLAPSAALRLIDLDETALRRLAPDGCVRTHPKDSVVVCEGDYSDALYVVLSGRVKIYMSDEAGREVVLNVIEAGDYFGELVLDGGPRAASAMTMVPSRFFVMPRLAVARLIDGNPDFARDLIGRLLRKVRSLSGTVRDFALRDVYGRLATFINGHAVEQDGRPVLDRMTHQEIAARIGASREMVGRIFKELTTRPTSQVTPLAPISWAQWMRMRRSRRRS
jgi:CRP/FNR family cyclic AMP-dependent transcriptional regulator